MKNNLRTLYLIPSPIGNLNDISPRIKEAILDCDIIACEDTRNTMKLLNILNFKKPCISCHEHNEAQSSKNISKYFLENKKVGFLSDAGFPCISDPGYYLVLEAIKNDVKIIPISGPSAFLNALVASGISTEHFTFYGFLKSKSSDRKRELELLKKKSETLIFYEAPHRINDTLVDIFEIFGNRKCTIAREITKIHEEFIRSDLKTLVENKREIIGEIVLIVEGNSMEETISEKEIKDKVNILIENGLTKKDAILSVSILLNVPKNSIKKLFL